MNEKSVKHLKFHTLNVLVILWPRALNLPGIDPLIMIDWLGILGPEQAVLKSETVQEDGSEGGHKDILKSGTGWYMCVFLFFVVQFQHLTACLHQELHVSLFSMSRSCCLFAQLPLNLISFKSLVQIVIRHST